jgi:hypothetical protein
MGSKAVTQSVNFSTLKYMTLGTPKTSFLYSIKFILS